MIIGCFGSMSSGKGVISAAILRYCIKNNTKKVIANCYLKQDNFIQMNSEELYIKSKNPEFFRDSYLYITELHNIIDGRRTSSLMNTNFTQFLTQVGKLDCGIIYDSQLFESQIDVRLREFTNIRLICERFKIINGKVTPIDIFDDRIIKDEKGNLVPIAIKYSLDLSTESEDKIRPLGWYFPNDEDYSYFKTREIITLDREKFLKN